MTRAAKTASSCSMRCWPHANTWSSPTAVTTSARTSPARRRSRWESSSTSWTTPSALPRDEPATPSVSSTRCSPSTRVISNRASSSRPVPGASTSSTSTAPAPRCSRTNGSGGSWPTPWRASVETIDVDLLDRFLRDPVKVFLRERLGVSLWDRTREYEDAIPIVTDALTQWGIAERILQARLEGASWDDCEQAEIARGTLPPAVAGLPGARRNAARHRRARAGRGPPLGSAAGVARGRRRPAGPPVRRRHGGGVARQPHPHGDLPQDAARAAA